MTATAVRTNHLRYDYARDPAHPSRSPLTRSEWLTYLVDIAYRIVADHLLWTVDSPRRTVAAMVERCDTRPDEYGQNGMHGPTGNQVIDEAVTRGALTDNSGWLTANPDHNHRCSIAEIPDALYNDIASR